VPPLGAGAVVSWSHGRPRAGTAPRRPPA
jgi:hypothetical protein